MLLQSLLMLRGAERRSDLYVDANHGFAGVLAGSLQDSLPATHWLTSVQADRSEFGIHALVLAARNLLFLAPLAALSFAVLQRLVVRHSPG